MTVDQPFAWIVGDERNFYFFIAVNDKCVSPILVFKVYAVSTQDLEMMAVKVHGVGPTLLIFCLQDH
jgi:hypothetical protein